MQVVVGRVGKAHGVRGDVTVEVRTDDPEHRLGAGEVLLTDPERVGPLTVAAAKVHSGRLLLHFIGVEDRGAAEALRGTMLLAEVDPNERPEDPDDFYDHQLVGLAVLRRDGSPVGVLVEMLHLPLQDVLVVRRPDDSEVLVPFLSAFVPEVDLAGARVVIDPPPGLLEPAPDELPGELPGDGQDDQPDGFSRPDGGA